MDAKPPTPIFALISAGTLLAAVIVVASGYLLDAWAGRPLLLFSLLFGLLGASVLSGVASLWQRRLWIVGAFCALTSLYFIVTTISGLRRL